jgi:hypothetical protein
MKVYEVLYQREDGTYSSTIIKAVNRTACRRLFKREMVSGLKIVSIKEVRIIE